MNLTIESLQPKILGKIVMVIPKIKTKCPLERYKECKIIGQFIFNWRVLGINTIKSMITTPHTSTSILNNLFYLKIIFSLERDD